MTVAELQKHCNSLNIKLTKADGSRKLKKDLIKSLSKVNNKSIVGGGGRKQSSRKSRTNSRKKLSKRKTTRNRVGGGMKNISISSGDTVTCDDVEKLTKKNEELAAKNQELATQNQEHSKIFINLSPEKIKTLFNFLDLNYNLIKNLVNLIYPPNYYVSFTYDNDPYLMYGQLLKSEAETTLLQIQQLGVDSNTGKFRPPNVAMKIQSIPTLLDQIPDSFKGDKINIIEVFENETSILSKINN